MDRSSVLEHLPALRRYARVLTGDAWAADDLVQDTLERACGKWRLWLPGSDLRAWLFTLMHRVFLNQRRDGASHARVMSLDDAQDDLPGAARDLDSAIDLQRCLLRLPEEQRTVLLLVTLEDLSYADVAGMLGVPMGTVMSRLSRARGRLRELMGRDLPAQPPASATVTPLRRPN
ncbi:MAG: RNA polymerase sigma factor [Comamonas sp.]|nr:RNA polymerase sigma factor [Comamonas sp.]